ncbi:Uncharacterized RING finger protein C548.05c [Linum perenne]
MMELLSGVGGSRRTIDLSLPPPQENIDPYTLLRLTSHRHSHYLLPPPPQGPGHVLNAVEARICRIVAFGRRVVEPDDDEEVNEAEAVQRLRCPICISERVRDPTATLCGHVFCKTCIETALIWNKKCPTCRAPLYSEGSTVRIHLD